MFGSDGLPVDIKLPVKHILSKELQLYFDKITELVVSRSSSVLFKKASSEFSYRLGTSPIGSLFYVFIADEVARGLGDYSLLFALMRVQPDLYHHLALLCPPWFWVSAHIHCRRQIAVQEAIDRYVRSLSPSEAAVFFHSLAPSTSFKASVNQNPNATLLRSVAAATSAFQNSIAMAVESSEQRQWTKKGANTCDFNHCYHSNFHSRETSSSGFGGQSFVAGSSGFGSQPRFGYLPSVAAFATLHPEVAGAQSSLPTTAATARSGGALPFPRIWAYSMAFGYLCFCLGMWLERNWRVLKELERYWKSCGLLLELMSLRHCAFGLGVFGHVYNTLQTKLTKTLLNAFLDPKRALTQHYGAIQGLAALGMNVVHLLMLPNLEPYLGLLEPEMLLANQKNEMKRHEAWWNGVSTYVFQRAVGQCIYDRLKIFPPMPSMPAGSILRTNARVITTTFPSGPRLGHGQGEPRSGRDLGDPRLGRERSEPRDERTLMRDGTAAAPQHYDHDAST
ncbi:unnamed protein product [Citrullus colocynthis]|uniref:TAF6 C-terminal HEAT repeat domain-containing protein n=1 Tax=Citrullus colocynthis TaxID=252529 RepID=A0ABP0XRI0_9ROSI